MKVVKSAKHYTEAAEDEILLLSKAKQEDPDDRCHCCRLFDYFDHTGPHGRHICMVFEVLGDNLLALIRHYNHRGIPLPVVRNMTQQILIGLDFLHASCGIIHTDLKPENVMLKEPIKPRSPPKMVDLSLHHKEHHHPVVGKIAAALAAGQPLTKNQKKKLRKKMQKGNGSLAEMEDQGDSSSSMLKDDTDIECDSGTTGQRKKNGRDEGAAVDVSSQSMPQILDKTNDGDDDGLSGPSERVVESSRALEARLMHMQCKIVDFGNACWVHKHFTDDIQTRQYRSPEVKL